MTYVRRQPWRPRSPWLGARAGARRRGFRQDELAPISDGVEDGVDVLVSVTGEAVLDDVALAQRMSEPAAQALVPARVDVSGLQAIAALTSDRLSKPLEEVPLAADWHVFGEQRDEEHFLSLHTA